MSTFRAITATIKPRTALHVGSGASTKSADGLLRRRANGQLVIPGSALAGALRAIATRLAPRLGSAPCMALLPVQGSTIQPEEPLVCRCLVCQLFGSESPNDLPRGEGESLDAWLGRTGKASRLVFYDAVFGASPPSPAIRDGVGIDRTTGASARDARAKFTLEVLPDAGIESTAFLRIEIKAPLAGDDNEIQMQLLAASLGEWKAGRGAIGGHVSRGLGAFELSQVRFIERDLNQAATLMSFLREGPPWDSVLESDTEIWIDKQLSSIQITSAPADLSGLVAQSWAILEFTLAAEGPFLTHDVLQATRAGFHHAPVLAGYFGKKPPVLPGSSLRGVLRSQAERIARTLATLEAVKSVDSKKHFLDRCPACHPLAIQKDAALRSCSSTIRDLEGETRADFEQGLRTKELCLACQLFGNTWWGSRLRIEDAPLIGEPPTFKVLDFLAIDRFTDGGRDSAKFDAVVLWKPRFKVRLFLDNPASWELGWLALTLRDVHDGLATVGYGRSKGFGRCKIEEPTLKIGYLQNADFPLAQPSEDTLTVERQKNIQAAEEAKQTLLLHPDEVSELYHVVTNHTRGREKWLPIVNAWVSLFNDNLSMPRATTLKPTNDCYFNNQIDHLYPARLESEV